MRKYPDGFYRPSMLPGNVGDKSAKMWFHKNDSRIPEGYRILNQTHPDFINPGWRAVKVGTVWCEEMGTFPSYDVGEGIFSTFTEALCAIREESNSSK